MGTSYYLADSKYMSPQEIQRAHAFDCNAQICHKAVSRDSKGDPQLVYTLEVPNILFFNLPADVLLVNNNNDLEVKTIGDLIAQIERRKGKLITVDEAVELDKEAHEQWICSRPNTETWRSFMFQYDVDKTPTAIQYLQKNRKKIMPDTMIERARKDNIIHLSRVYPEYLVQLGSTYPVITQNRTLYVLVHPFWGDDKHPYIDNIERLVRETESPILTLDTWLNDTIPKYTKLNPKGDRFFLPNGFPNAKPDCGWEILAEIINRFESEEVRLGGSQLGGNETDYWHCVGLNYKNLRSLVPTLRIEESLCDR